MTKEEQLIKAAIEAKKKKEMLEELKNLEKTINNDKR